MSDLSITFPKGFVGMLSRRHNGDQTQSNDRRAKTWYLMQKLYDDHKKYSKMEHDLLFIEWDEKQIERHFGEPIFYGAHRRLKNYRKKLNEIHKNMFILLTRMDGISCDFGSGSDIISPEEIYLDFKSKYVDKVCDAFPELNEGKNK